MGKSKWGEYLEYASRMSPGPTLSFEQSLEAARIALAAEQWREHIEKIREFAGDAAAMSAVSADHLANSICRGEGPK